MAAYQLNGASTLHTESDDVWSAAADESCLPLPRGVPPALYAQPNAADAITMDFATSSSGSIYNIPFAGLPESFYSVPRQTDDTSEYYVGHGLPGGVPGAACYAVPRATDDTSSYYRQARRAWVCVPAWWWLRARLACEHGRDVGRGWPCGVHAPAARGVAAHAGTVCDAGCCRYGHGLRHGRRAVRRRGCRDGVGR